MNDIIPRHIAIVMDGNGRWAVNRGLLRVEGHSAGVKAVKKIIRCCLQHEVGILSLFAFSSENWARPEAEVEFLMTLFLESLRKEVDELHQHGVSLHFIGNRQALSPILQKEMEQAEMLTAANTKLILNIVVNYGGRWDVTQAAKTIVQEVADGKLNPDEIDEAVFGTYLSTKGLADPDLFIRTSGEQRISNFFLWQLAYTEFYFSEKHWPDFNAEEFQNALMTFKQRERRYGKTSAQLNGTDYV